MWLFEHLPVARFLNHLPYHWGIFQCVQHSISNYPFKQVNHFYAFSLGRRSIFVVKKCFVSGHQAQKAYIYTHNFSVSLLSSSGTHQSHQRDGSQAMGINSSFIEAFWALRFLLSLCGFFLTAFIFGFLKLLGTYSSNHGYFLTALLHISRVLY